MYMHTQMYGNLSKHKSFGYFVILSMCLSLNVYANHILCDLCGMLSRKFHALDFTCNPYALTEVLNTVDILDTRSGLLGD